MRCFSYALALFLVCTISTAAQNYVVVEALTSGYPSVVLRAYGFDENGAPQSVSGATLKEDGVDRQANVFDEPSSDGKILSCMVLVSTSANLSSGGNPSNLLLAKSAATAAASPLTSTSDEIGLGIFDARARILHGLTNDKQGYAQAIADIAIGSGCNLDSGLLAKPEGALTHLRNARYNRMLLLIVDGAPSFAQLKAAQTAISFHIPVYIIGIRTTLSAELKQLSDTTGGAYAEGVSTDADAATYARAFVSHAKQLPATRLSYTSAAQCSPMHTVEVTSASIVRQFTYQLPSILLPYLEWDVTGVDFGTASAASERTVQLTARNKAITITSLSSDDPSFTIVTGITPGTVLQQNASIPVTVRYQGGAQGAFGTLTLVADGSCATPELPMRAGGYTSGKTLKVVSPNGGESYLAGRATAIRWTNVLPEDVVRIEYSSNDGTSWMPLTETATGLSYTWVPGPELTTSGRIRIQRTAIPAEAIVTLSGHRDPVYGAAFSYDGQYVITGGHDGTVRLWNSATGTQVQELGNHGSQFAWAVAAHPSELIGASGGHDGTVKVYDLVTGERLAVIYAPSRVWSVAFSPDGNNVVIGTEQSILIVNWRTSEVVNSIVVAGGPVYEVRYSSDGTMLLSAEADRASLRSTTTYDVLQTLATGTGIVFAADISPDNKTIATGGSDFILRTWDVQNGNLIGSTPSYNASIQSLDFSASGSTIVAGSSDGAAKVFRTATLELANSFASSSSIIYCVQYDNQGNRIVTAGTDAKARVWNLQGATLSEDVSDATFTIRGGKIEQNSIDHGDIYVGDADERVSQVLKNTGSDTLVVNGWRLVSGDLAEVDVPTVSKATLLAPNESLSLRTICQPASTGDVSATLLISAGGGNVSTTIRGKGVQQQLVTPDVVNFGRHIAGQSVIDTTILLQARVGSTPVTVTRTVLMGVQQGAFEIVEGGGTFSIGSGQTHKLSLRYSPASFGRFAAWIEFTLEDGSVRTMCLYGEGTGDARFRSSASTLLFTTDQCSSASVSESVSVSNAGNTPLIIYNAEITGTHANEFTLVAPDTFPVQIAPNDTVKFQVSFDPQSVGVKDAALQIASSAVDAINGISVIAIVARKDSVGFELSRTKVDFDGVNEGEKAIQRITIFNTGSTTLRWPVVGTLVGSFRISAPEPPVTPPGGASEVTIEFLGGSVNQSYTGSYNYVDTVCNRSRLLELSATVKSYIGCTVAIDTVGTTIGSTVSVPIRIRNKVNFDRTSITEIHARIRVNGSILKPVGIQSTQLGNGDRVFEVAIPIPQSGDLASNLTFNTMWGNDTAGFIRLDSVWSADTVLIRTVHGQVQLTDLCREGGPRLLLRERDRNGGLPAHAPAQVRVVPAPVSSVATIDLRIVEDGPTRVDLVDASGKVVQTLVDRELTIGNYLLPLEVDSLENGMYTLQLVTRTQRMSNRFTVVK